jgi:hypothetical protein
MRRLEEAGAPPQGREKDKGTSFENRKGETLVPEYGSISDRKSPAPAALVREKVRRRSDWRRAAA